MAEFQVKKQYTEEELLDLAAKRIKIKRGLYSHIASYVFVNGFLVFLYFVTFNDYSHYEVVPWFVWPLGGWGLGLAFHIFGTIQELNFKYNSNAVNKELEKLKKNLK